MREKLKIALWERVKSTYPGGTSEHRNALLEEDFDSFIDEVVKICNAPTTINCTACGVITDNKEYCDVCECRGCDIYKE